MSIIVMFCAVVGAFIMGIALGHAASDGYKSKKVCRECRRTMVEYGFLSDGKEYKCVEVKEGDAQ